MTRGMMGRKSLLYVRRASPRNVLTLQRISSVEALALRARLSLVPIAKLIGQTAGRPVTRLMFRSSATARPRPSRRASRYVCCRPGLYCFGVGVNTPALS